MRIATWNVNSIIARLPNVTRWLEQTKPDVLCMQETKCTDDKFPGEEFEKLGYQCLMFGQQSYNGLSRFFLAMSAMWPNAVIQMIRIP
jgi:exodeoxyribonuclease-3